MTPEEINKALGELCEIKLVPFHPIGQIKGWYFWDDKLDRYEEWHPYSDIKQAFEVVEKMREKGYILQLWYLVKSANKVRATFHLAKDIGYIYEQFAEKPEQAICLACIGALKARGNDDL